MRSFGGDLGLVSLADLLQLLSTNRPRGFLTLSNGDQKKTIQFCSGGIRLVSGVRRTNPLGQILVRSGGITADQLKDLLAEQRGKTTRLGDLAAERGVLSKEALEQALRDQAAEEIYEIFSWTEGKFYFMEGTSDAVPEGAGPLAPVLLDTNVMSIMIEAARRSDEMARIRTLIPVDDLVPKKTDAAVALDDPGIDRNAAVEILTLVDGKRSVDQIIQNSLYPKFAVLRTLYELAERGVVILGESKESETSLRPRERVTAARGLNPATKGRTVLVISELVSFREALALSLRNEGYSVVQGSAWGPSEASVVAACVDAIILDISFEGGEALTVCERIRAETKRPFIVMSENTSQAAFDSALQCGARYVLLKPIKEEVLLERLAQLLGLPARP